MKELTFTVPGAPDQYVKILSSSGQLDLHWVQLGAVQQLSAREFDEVIIARGSTVLRVRCDRTRPPGVPAADLFDHESRLIIKLRTQASRELRDNLELRMHLSTPVAPRDGGVWVRLVVKNNNGKLAFQGRHLAYQGCHFELSDPNPKAADRISSVPDWFNDIHARWTVRMKDRPAAGNALLSFSPGARATANLVHLDPGREGDGAGNAKFSLYLEEHDGVFELCTELELRKDFVSRAPVSGYALRLHSDARASAPFAAEGLLLRCRQYETFDGWTLRWPRVLGCQHGAHDDALTLESLTQALLDQHAPGLATVRARNRLSFIPTWIRTEDEGAQVELRFEVEASRREQLALRTRLAEIVLPPAAQRLQLHCAGALDQQGNALVLHVAASDSKTPLRGEVLTLASWDLAPAPGNIPCSLGIGSVRLGVDGFQDGTLRLGISSAPGIYRRAALESILSLRFERAAYSALSMDPELGFETLSAETARPRPWTFDLSGQQPCWLTVTESTNQAQSRSLHMELKLPRGGTRSTDVVLVDPSPLTVVRVRTTEKQKVGEILAEYVDDADQAPEWRFHSAEGRMTAILPPQGIGEEMIKGTLHLDRKGTRVRVPAEGSLFDFRLTSVARLVLDRTDVNTARSEAPWSLRRLLGRRLGVTGVKLDRAEFELLYGMSAKLEAPGLRIAELDGFIGRIPFTESLRRNMRGNPVVEAHGEATKEWISAIWQRPSWWRVYADLANRDRLRVERGIEYRLRPSRQTADPFDIGRYATAEVPGREPLRGGVDWPFQSRSVYAELAPKEATVSSAGSIEGLVFGSLGGEGAQTAAFNNGKTLIITNSRQGRIDSLTLIRVGRIAMLWNKARHVIVYERTTRRAKRYEGAETDKDDLEVQPEFKGLAALRKVREYVEITEPRRRYPDSRAERPISGPLTQSVFNTTVIPVRSDWGRDLRNGFAIALRGPLPAGKEAQFPDPQVFLDFARAHEKGEGGVGQRILNTRQLVFFTSTREEDGGDTDKWPAWPEVDFPLIRPPPPPQLPFSSSFRGSKRQPDAIPVELGMAPFTFSLAPAEEATNLMHRRPVGGLESRIFNINLARGLPASAPPGLPPEKLAALDTSKQVGALHSVLLDGLAELRNELRERVLAGQSFMLDEQPQLKKDIGALLDRLGGALAKNPVSGAPKDGRDWKAMQERRLQAYTAGVRDEVGRLQRQLAGQVLGADLEQARAGASAIVESVGKQAQQRIAEVGFVPMLALDAVQRGIEAAQRRFEGELAGLAAPALQLVDDLERRYRKDPDTAATLETLWREHAGQLPERLRLLLDHLGDALEGELGAWFSKVRKGGAATVYELAQQGAATRVEAVADWLARWCDALPPFDLEAPDFAHLRDVLGEALSGSLAQAILEEASAWLKSSLAEVGDWAQLLDGYVKDLEDLEASLAEAIGSAGTISELQAALEAASEGLRTRLGEAADEIAGQLRANIGQLSFIGAEGALDVLKTFHTDAGAAIEAMTQSLGGDLAALEEAVRLQASEVEQRVQASARQVEDWVSQEIGAAYQIARENIDSGLEAVRLLAEGPVTDAMRASRERIGYYFHQSEAGVMLTRASAVFNELSGDVLNALNVDMPFDRVTDRLKACVGGMMVRDLFPSLAGIDMTYLLPDLNVPLEGDEQYEWLRLQHGFDKDRLRAWARVSIDKRFDSDATLFDLGPVKLRLLKPLFYGSSDIIVEKDKPRTQKTFAKLNADFEMSLNGHPVVTLRRGTLSFDESGKLDFQLDANDIELAAELQFISDALKSWQPDIAGFALTPLLPGGVSTALSVPLPDIGTGAFTLTGITLNTHFDLRIADGFEISSGLWLSKPDRPFGLAVLFLGGGGWFGIDASYSPPSRFTTRVSIGISAGAFIALNFGFATGSAGILFTASVDFYRDWQAGSGSTAIALGIIIWGEFSVLGIASASMRLVLRITYTEDGGMVGTGDFRVSIKICWCYTLRVNRRVQKRFSGSGGARRAEMAPSILGLLPAASDGATPSYAALPKRAEPAAAVSGYLETLAIVMPQ